MSGGVAFDDQAMIKYIGSKRMLLPVLCEIVEQRKAHSFVDLFSGTSRVGHAMKARGLQVHANDHNAYAAALARCYVQSDRERVEADAGSLIREFNALPGVPGYFTQTFCEQSRFFQPFNGARIDAIRDAIAAKGLEPELESVLLVALMEAADRVDSTIGIQMAYLKQWAPRSARPLELRLPAILPAIPSGAPSSAHHMDALEAVDVLEGDVFYLDPPYNGHRYLNNYHIWESLVLWDRPEVYGVARKRVDCRARRSPFNFRQSAHTAMQTLIQKISARWLIVSFNNESFFSREEMEEMLAMRGPVEVREQDFRRYIGASIGIHGPTGEKVGTISHLRNKEYIYIVG